MQFLFCGDFSRTVNRGDLYICAPRFHKRGNFICQLILYMEW
jgi:hypothetical protein